MGFSFVSAIELIYFFSVRLISDYIKQNNHSKRIEELNKKQIFVKSTTNFDYVGGIPQQHNIRFRTNSNSMFVNWL